MSSFLRRCVECPKCLTRYLIAFSPYCNGSYLVPTVVASPEEYILYCSCGRPPCLTRLPRDVETTQTILREPVDSGHTHQTVQDVLDGLVVLERSREDGETRFNINSLKHLKSFFSGAFRLALQQEYDEGRNPVRETSLPKARGPEDTYAYSLEEILAMIEVVPEPASSVIATAAFAGARRGEIRGMFCEN